jgi:hypothetical protein
MKWIHVEDLTRKNAQKMDEKHQNGSVSEVPPLIWIWVEDFTKKMDKKWIKNTKTDPCQRFHH